MRPTTPFTSAIQVLAIVAFLALAACAAPGEQAAATLEVTHQASLAALLPNGQEPLEGVVTGGQPSGEQLDAAAAAGVKTVINLRAEGESDIGRADSEARGMTYVAFPIAGKDDLTAERAAAFDQALAAAERPVLVHCGSGNRVGALFALRAHHVEGADIETALTVGRSAGLTRLEDAVVEVLAESEPAGDE